MEYYYILYIISAIIVVIGLMTDKFIRTWRRMENKIDVFIIEIILIFAPFANTLMAYLIIRDKIKQLFKNKTK